MSSKSAMKKEFDRWMPRLNDLSRDVRLEAVDRIVKIIVKIANLDVTLKLDAIVALASYLKSLKKSSDDTEVYVSLVTVHCSMFEDISLSLASSTEMLDALLNCPTNYETTSHQLMKIFLRLIEKGEIQSTHSAARSIVKLAMKVSKLKHCGGRREALLIMDWGEDNLENSEC